MPKNEPPRDATGKKSPGGAGERRPTDAADLPRMGGIALKNGLILVSEKHWAAAVRDAAGLISVASGVKPRVVAQRAPGTRPGAPGEGTGGIPVLRGLGRFGETLLVLAQAKMSLPGAELPLEGGRIVAALGAALGANAAVRALAPKSPLVQEVGGAVAAFIPAVVALKNSPISGYHGAEHKVIGGREALARMKSIASAAGSAAATVRESSAVATSRGSGERARATRAAAQRAAVERAAASGAASKEHDRCGTNLVGPYLLATVATNLLARGRSGRKSPAASAVAGAASLGLAIEALRWATTHGDNIVARIMLAPGRLLQKQLTTSEPTAEQLEVGERAMDELLRLEGAAG